nr:LysR family transcriptional regulator [Tanacetum cinerariifolium]
MKIDDIDAFVAVIRCQSISHAAESLELTQPAITRRVQNFEQALGVELFDRNTKPLKPTPMGTQVYQKCLAILREMDALRELVASDTPPSGLLRLGAANHRRRGAAGRAETSAWAISRSACASGDRGLSLKVNLETFGTELQLGLVADGLGLGLVPRPLLERSSHRDSLAVMPLKDFKPVLDLWLIQPRFLGNLQAPVAAFGKLVAGSLKQERDAA